MYDNGNWEKFQKESDRYLSQIDYNKDITTFDNVTRQGIISAESITKSKGKVKRRAAPRWDDKCEVAVRS